MTELFEIVEEPLDILSQFVLRGIVMNYLGPIDSGRENGLNLGNAKFICSLAENLAFLLLLGLCLALLDGCAFWLGWLLSLIV